MLKTDGNPFLGEQPFATDCHFSCHFVVGRLTPDCAIDRTLRNTTLHDKSKNHLGELKISKCPILCVLTTLFIGENIVIEATFMFKCKLGDRST